MLLEILEKISYFYISHLIYFFLELLGRVKESELLLSVENLQNDQSQPQFVT